MIFLKLFLVFKLNSFVVVTWWGLFLKGSLEYYWQGNFFFKGSQQRQQQKQTAFLSSHLFLLSLQTNLIITATIYLLFIKN